ncbi:MAG: ISAs1 family transposase [Tunicatimonas sp.]|uniref:ISAs1 family transposase n=1 Tax=Tunicatimonas sp. TaxID=1940096 RepID=UPI003C78E935
MIDPRDNRGKRHDLHFVLFGVLLAVMTGKVLIAEIHRFLVRHHHCLCSLLGLSVRYTVSDVQLRRLLALVDTVTYQHFHTRYFGWQACLLASNSWVSFDGKELRGTIDGVLGEKRGLCIVRPLLHQSSISLSGLFYHGAKESEITCVRELLQEDALASQHLTFDALHTQSQTLEMVQNAKGTYIAQVKANQPVLLEDLQDHIKLIAPIAKQETSEKGHGRIERRKASFYPTDAVCFEEKWDSSKFAVLVVVERESTQCKTGKVSRETSYYLSNASIEQITPQEFLQAIRQHWSIEADNWVRDATFREDRIRCKEPARSKTLASIISVAGNLLRQQKKGYLKAMQEELTYNLSLAVPLFKHADFL